MARVKPLIRPDPRESQLLGEIGKAQSMTKKSYRYLCEKAGVTYGTFMAHRKNVKNMRYGELWAFFDACRKEIEK